MCVIPTERGDEGSLREFSLCPILDFSSSSSLQRTRCQSQPIYKLSPYREHIRIALFIVNSPFEQRLCTQQIHHMHVRDLIHACTVNVSCTQSLVSICQMFFVIVNVIAHAQRVNIIVKRLLSIDSTLFPILDIDATGRIHLGAALEVVVGGG